MIYRSVIMSINCRIEPRELTMVYLGPRMSTTKAPIRVPGM